MWYNLGMTKVCTKCQTLKTLDQFGNRSNTKDGKDIYCKLCKHYFTQQWKLKNPEKLKEGKSRADAAWYAKHKSQKLEINRQWKTKNATKSKEWFKDYKRDREKVDPAFKLMNKIRTRLWYALKKNKKQDRTIDLLGCSVCQLKEHLEQQFKEGMSWANYGKWHIDHIMPLTAFDLSNPEELKKACHYSNLQPLWAKENLSKSSKKP